MSSHPVQPSLGSVFWAFARELVTFVRELAINPQAPDMLNGHQPDQLGWCSHPGHTSPERHPCSTLLWSAVGNLIIALGAAALAEGVDATGWHQEPADTAGQANAIPSSTDPRETA
jgi:hypothetical protein